MAAQKLILPINKTRVTAGYKNATYNNQFGFKHYGSDSTSTGSDRTVWGCGVGQVLEAGFDNVLGNVVIIRYNNCQLKNGTTKDLIQRLYHLGRIDVVKGQSITKDTRVGLYGSTGQYATGPHLHVEFDTDVKYPAYSPTLGSSSNIIKAGTDSTLNPTDVLYVKNTAPDYQSVVGASNSDCWSSSDVSYSKHDGSAPDGEIGALYYSKPNYSGTSLVEALKSIGVDSSFTNREKIAAANGISDYAGTAAQNNTLLNLLMNGQLKRPVSVEGDPDGGGTGTSYYPKPNYGGTSLVEALKSIGVDSSFANREKIAAANGISDYTGTTTQNNMLFNLLMNGQLKRPNSLGEDVGGDTGEGLTEIGFVPGLSIRKNLVSSSKYDIKAPYLMDPVYITVHNTYNDASAENEVLHMNRNNDEVSFHYAVDDKEAVQGLPLNRNAWHAGDGAQGTGNRKSIAVEICYSKSGGDRFDKAEQNAARLIAALMEHFNIPIDRVRKHQDWSGKYCPHRTLDAGWDRYKDMIQGWVRAEGILKYASKNGLLTDTGIMLKNFNQKEKLLEIPGTLPGRPHLIVYGEVGLYRSIQFGNEDASLKLSHGSDGLAANITTLLGKGDIAFDIDTERLAVTLSEINMAAFGSDVIKVSLNIDKMAINIVAEVEEPYTADGVTTTFYQRLIITVHPDIQQPGLLHVPVFNPNINEVEMQEGIEYIKATNTVVLTTGVVLIAIATFAKDSQLVQILKALLAFPLRMMFSTNLLDGDNKEE